jgi:hypothetical protein
MKKVLGWVIPIGLWIAFYLLLGGFSWQNLLAAIIAVTAVKSDEIIDGGLI